MIALQGILKKQTNENLTMVNGSNKIIYENSTQTKLAWSKYLRVQNAILTLNCLSISIGMTFFDISRDQYRDDFQSLMIPLINISTYDCLLYFSSIVALIIILLTFYNRYLSIQANFYKGKNLKFSFLDLLTGSNEMYMTLLFAIFHPNRYFDSFQTDGAPSKFNFMDDNTNYTLNDIFCLLNLLKISIIFISIVRLIPYNSDIADRVW